MSDDDDDEGALVNDDDDDDDGDDGDDDDDDEIDSQHADHQDTDTVAENASEAPKSVLEAALDVALKPRKIISATEIAKMISNLPVQIDAAKMEPTLWPIFEALSCHSNLIQEAFFKDLKKKTGLTLEVLRESVDDIGEAPAVRGEVIAVDGAYKDVASGDIVSTFLIKPKRRVRGDDGVEALEVDLVNVKNDAQATIVLAPTAFQSKKSFFQHLRTADFQFMGTDENLQNIAKDLSEHNLPVANGTSVVGYFELNKDPRWIAPDVLISKRGVNVETDLLCANPHRSLAKRLSYPVVDDKQVRLLAQRALPLLATMNAPAVILLVLAWYVAAVCKVQLSRILGHFPILCVAGTKGAGKTNMLQQVSRAFGITQLEPFSVNGTKFVLMRLLASTTSVPVFIDEFKPSDMEPRQVALVQRLLRQVYGGEIEERGHGDQSVAQYPLTAPVVMAGEAEVSDDPALRERVVVVRPDKHDLERHPQWQEAFRVVSGLPLEQLAAPFIEFSLKQDVVAELKQARVLVATFADRTKDLPLRHHDNLLVQVFGLHMLNTFAESLGVTLSLDAKTMVETFLNQTLDGCNGVKDAFDDFLAECATHARAGDLVDGTHYAFVGGKLCIHLSSCHQVYLEKRSKTGRKDATNGVPALKRIINEKIKSGGYVIKADHRAKLGTTTPRTVEIDVSLIPDALGIDEFPKENDRRHGGARDMRIYSTAALLVNDGVEPDLTLGPS